MTLRLYDEELSNVLVDKEYTGSPFSSMGIINDHTTHLEHPMGKGYYREIHFEGVRIGFGDAFLSDKILLSFESDFETVEMHFALKGKSTVIAENFGRGICFEAHQHNIIYSNGMCGKMQWECDALKLCEINLSPEFFKKFLPEDAVLFDKFRNTIEKGNSALIGLDHHRISHQMYLIIHEITTCERKGAFKRMFLEAKVIELLLLQFEQLADNEFSKTSLKKKDIDKIYAVREFMLNNLNSPCSLIALAHKAGTNEFTLKKGFKELFGTTVFGFWNNAKMDQAKLLLVQQNMNIGEISNLMGYKNQRHFSAAFTRKFGILPSRLIRK